MRLTKEKCSIALMDKSGTAAWRIALLDKHINDHIDSRPVGKYPPETFYIARGDFPVTMIHLHFDKDGLEEGC
jgi:hypothetical protein